MRQREQYEFQLIYVSHDDQVHVLNTQGSNGWRVVSSHTFENCTTEFVMERKKAG